jgi:hypothetical protein
MMKDIANKLEDKKIKYLKKEYLFISDIYEITGIQKTYVYLLKKKNTIRYFSKEGITLIEYDSFINYLENRKKRGDDNASRKVIINKIKKISDEKLKEIEKLLES